MTIDHLQVFTVLTTQIRVDPAYQHHLRGLMGPDIKIGMDALTPNPKFEILSLSAERNIHEVLVRAQALKDAGYDVRTAKPASPAGKQLYTTSSF